MENMLKDRVAIITGSGRGIGRGAALLFAQEGAKVVVNDIDPGVSESVVEEIKRIGGEAVSCDGDVTAADFGERIVKTAVDTWGNLHIIVNNAGFTWDGVIHKMSDEQWNAMLNIHVTAPFRILRAAAPYLRGAAKKEAAAGNVVARKIINVSSMAGTNGNAGQANYSSAKSAVLGLTKTMSKEWGRFNVQANAVAYGMIDTRLTQEKEEGETLDREGEIVALGIPKAQRQMMSLIIPMGRPGTVDEAAGPILFLASPLSDYVSGHVLIVSGGL